MKVARQDRTGPPEHPLSDPLAKWPAFTSATRARMDKGRAVYGDRSFSADPAELAREIMEELEDVAGWAFVLWCRMAQLREAVDHE